MTRTEVARTLVRPLVTLIFSVSFCVACLRSDDPVESLKDISLTVVAFWFAGRGAPEK